MGSSVETAPTDSFRIYGSCEKNEVACNSADFLPRLCAQYLDLFSNGTCTLRERCEAKCLDIVIENEAQEESKENIRLAVSDPITACCVLAASSDRKCPEIAETLLPAKDLCLRAKIDKWLGTFAQQRGVVRTNGGLDEVTLSAVNSALLENTFFVGHNVTVVDLVAFPFVHTWILQASVKMRLAQAGVLRWFNHMQFLPGFLETPFVGPGLPRDMVCVFPRVELGPMIEAATPPFEVDLAAKTAARKAPQLADVSASAVSPGARSSGGDMLAVADADRHKQESLQPNLKHQKPKPSQKASAKQPVSIQERPPEDPTRLNVVVGKVLKVWNHPDAERLYCEEIDIGEPTGPRRIASGLRAHVEQSAFEGQLVLVLANLKEKPLRGFPSHGMVLCVTNNTNISEVALLKPPDGSKVGDQVIPEGLSGDPDQILSAKKGKDTFALVQPHLKVVDGIAYWKDLRLVTSSSGYQAHCHCEAVRNGSIS